MEGNKSISDTHTIKMNKVIPLQYEKPILTALAAYPELTSTHIHFKLTDKHPVPYGTTPTLGSLFKPPHKRIYYITLLEESQPPELAALFKNLSFEAQVAVIAHELVHVVQFNSCSAANLLKTMLMYPLPAFKKKLERGADTGAIEHGFGSALYSHAVHLRSIPGYEEKRPEINKYYLKPGEILELLEGQK
ncbi:MAG: hypothetical protein JWO32_1304 [Bacteroidetes bacterium]|nr:hypothetical protein [Bacteroidota bacterium]